MFLSVAAHAAPTLVVFDASGSMGRPLNGATRLDAAKSAVGEIVEYTMRTSPEHEVGLIAFYEGCWVHYMVEHAPIRRSRGTILRQVGSLTVEKQGHTPIAQSLERAAGILQETGGTTILVSDGQESCQEQRDLCQLAAELEAQNVNFDVHLIGFALSQEQADALRCVAENTGGSFLRANDRKGLHKALALAMAVAVEKATPQCNDNRGGLLYWWCPDGDETP